MTTVPGHNIVIQQSGVAQELIHQTTTPKPSPEQAAAQQEASELMKNTTVQGFDEAERLRLKAKAEKEALRRKRRLEAKKKKRHMDEDPDPDATGRLLDTRV